MAATCGVALASTLAFAQGGSSTPDLRGTWTGTNEAVVLGSGMHYPGAETPAMPRTVKTEFTMTITGQDGRRFWGEAASKDSKEAFVGIIGNDGSAVYTSDKDGYSIDRLVAEDKIDLCYLRSGPDLSVAACNLFTKQ